MRLELEELLRNIVFTYFAALGLCCYTRAFSGCCELELPYSCSARASHCGDFSCCGAQALECLGALVVVCGLSICSLQAPELGLGSCGIQD